MLNPGPKAGCVPLQERLFARDADDVWDELEAEISACKAVIRAMVARWILVRIFYDLNHKK